MSNLNPLFQDPFFPQNIGQPEVDREIIARGILQVAESGTPTNYASVLSVD